MLLAEALKKAKELNTEEILKAFDNLEFDAPQGHVKIDAATHHIWAKARIGKVNAEGKFDVVFESDDIIQPIPEKK
jgi:ABC-type branched-subunit amino acid transport system substrate-binding protein